jgi:hypothetical protein
MQGACGFGVQGNCAPRSALSAMQVRVCSGPTVFPAQAAVGLQILRQPFQEFLVRDKSVLCASFKYSLPVGPSHQPLVRAVASAGQLEF